MAGWIQSGEMRARRSPWRLSIIPDTFFALINLILSFFRTMFSLDAHQNYGRRSDNRRPGSYGGGGGFGPGGPGGPGGPSGGYGRGPPRGIDNVRGIDHNAPNKLLFGLGNGKAGQVMKVHLLLAGLAVQDDVSSLVPDPENPTKVFGPSEGVEIRSITEVSLRKILAEDHAKSSSLQSQSSIKKPRRFTLTNAKGRPSQILAEDHAEACSLQSRSSVKKPRRFTIKNAKARPSQILAEDHAISNSLQSRSSVKKPRRFTLTNAKGFF